MEVKTDCTCQPVYPRAYHPPKEMYSGHCPQKPTHGNNQKQAHVPPKCGEMIFVLGDGWNESYVTITKDI